MRNNIIEGSGGSASWLPSYGLDSGHNLDIDPLFIDSAAVFGADNTAITSDDGLRLNSSSPAINAGINIAGLSSDLLGNAITGITDIGAYEFSCSLLDVLNINTAINHPGGTFQASNYINANNEINSSSTVTFEAGKSIKLEPGFMTTSDVVFTAKINDPCLNEN